MYESDDFGRTIMDTYTKHMWEEVVEIAEVVVDDVITTPYSANVITHTVYEAADTTKYSVHPNPSSLAGTLFGGTIAVDATTEIVKLPKMNPSFDPSAAYVPRAERKEWDAVGFMGKLMVRSAEAITGTHVDADANGKAVNGTTYRVLEVINANVVRVLFFAS